MLRFYGFDLWPELGGPRLGWRRLSRLVGQLPADAATWRSVHGSSARWGAVEHLLAAVVDHLASGNWQRGGGRGRRPKPIPRPGADRSHRTGDATRMTPAAARALLDARKPPPPPRR